VGYYGKARLACGIDAGKFYYTSKPMAHLADWTVCLLTTFVEAFVVYLSVTQGLFRKFIFLNSYLLLSVVIAGARWAMYAYVGSTSNGFYYFYFGSELLLTIALFLSVCELSVRLAGAKIDSGRIILWSAGALVVAAIASLPVASRNPEGPTVFVFTLSQNVYYACCVAIVALWSWKLGNETEDRIAVRFVNVLSIYFSVYLVIDGASRFRVRIAALSSLDLMLLAWLPLGCGFAIVSQQQPDNSAR
jgi:hypothetical protein